MADHDKNITLSETAAWYWLAYESGLGLRHAKTVLVEHIVGHSQSLCEVISGTLNVWELALGLTAEEAQKLEQHLSGLDEVTRALWEWQTNGMGLLRLNEMSYPPTLTAHLNPDQRPLFLSYRGEIGLLELPTVLALAGDPPDEGTTDWTLNTLFALAAEGALPLAIAQPGLDVAVVRFLLQAEAPIALVIPQGLANYQPPAGLTSALDAGRAVLLSPFRPDYSPPAGTLNPMLHHASDFAQALAHTLLLVEPPYPQTLLPDQPCFLRHGIPKTVGCQTYYTEPEALFMSMVESPIAAMAANAPVEPDKLPETVTPPQPQLDPEELISQLAELGNVPEAMKARLRSSQQ